MCNRKNQNDTFQQEQQEIMKRLKEAGIRVSIGKRVPQDGRYSGVVGGKRKELHIRLPSVYD